MDFLPGVDAPTVAETETPNLITWALKDNHLNTSALTARPTFWPYSYGTEQCPGAGRLTYHGILAVAQVDCVNCV